MGTKKKSAFIVWGTIKSLKLQRGLEDLHYQYTIHYTDLKSRSVWHEGCDEVAAEEGLRPGFDSHEGGELISKGYMSQWHCKLHSSTRYIVNLNRNILHFNCRSILLQQHHCKQLSVLSLDISNHKQVVKGSPHWQNQDLKPCHNVRSMRRNRICCMWLRENCSCWSFNVLSDPAGSCSSMFCKEIV